MDGSKFDIARDLAAAVPEIPEEQVTAWVLATYPSVTIFASATSEQLDALLASMSIEQLAVAIREDMKYIDHRFKTKGRVEKMLSPGNSRGPRRRVMYIDEDPKPHGEGSNRI